MDLSISINLDNAAFDDDHAHYETARILSVLAARIKAGQLDLTGPVSHGLTLKDIEGNTVGSVSVLENVKDMLARHARRFPQSEGGA